MSVITGWKILVNAFGSDCIVQTKFGAKLSVPKILESGEALNVIKKLGFEPNKVYKLYGKEYTPVKYIGRDDKERRKFDLTEFFYNSGNHYHFTKSKTKIIITEQ